MKIHEFTYFPGQLMILLNPAILIDIQKIIFTIFATLKSIQIVAFKNITLGSKKSFDEKVLEHTTFCQDSDAAK